MKSSLHDTIYVFPSIPPASYTTATNNGLFCDLQGFDEALVILNIGTMAGGATLTVSMKTNASASTSGAAALTGASFGAMTAAANASLNYVGRIDLSHLDVNNTQRYLYAFGVGDAANACLYDVQIVLSNYKYRSLNGATLTPNGNATQTATFNVAP